MSITAKDLEACIINIYGGSREANDFIMTINKNPAMLPLFLQCFQSTQVSQVKMVCLIVIRQMILDYGSNYEILPIENQKHIFDLLVNLIPKESDDLLRNNMGELITNICLEPGMKASFQCTQFSLQLIHTGQLPLISTGLYIISNSFSGLEEERQQPEFFFNILPLAIQFLTNPDQQCRYRAMELINSIMPELFEDLNDEKLNELNDFFLNSIMRNVNRVISEPVDPKEVTQIFDNANLLIQRINYFNQYVLPFTQLLIEIIVNPNIPCMTRAGILDSISEIFETKIEIIDPILEPLIKNCIRLEVEVKTNSPYEENDNLYSIIANLQYSKGSEFVDEFFYNTSNSLIEEGSSSGNLAMICVGMSIVGNLVLLSEDFAQDNIDSVLDLIFRFLAPKGEMNPFIRSTIVTCSMIVSKLCDISPDIMAVQEETLIPLLFNYLTIIESLDALIDLVSIIDLTPEKTMVYLRQLLNFIHMSFSNSEFQLNSDNLIQLLTKFIENVVVVDESIYNEVIPLIQFIIESENSSPSQKVLAAGCFAGLVKTCPNSSMGSIDNFIQMCLGFFSDFDPETNFRITEFIQMILENQSKFLLPYIPAIIEKVIQLVELGNAMHANLSKEVPTTEEEDMDEDQDNLYVEKSNSIYLMQSSAAILLSKICAIYPNESSGIFENVFGILTMLTNSIDTVTRINALQCFNDLSEAYMAVNSDPAPLLEYLIKQLDNSAEEYAETMEAINDVMFTCGSRLILVASGEIIKIVADGLFKVKKIFNKRGDVEEMDFKLRDPLFSILNTFIDELGPGSIEFLGEIVNKIVEMTNNRSKESHCYANLSLAKIAANMPQGSESSNFMELALRTAIQDINVKNKLVKKSYGLKTLNVVLSGRPDLVDPHKGNLFQYCANILRQNAAGEIEAPSFLNECILLLMQLIRTFNAINDESLQIIFLMLNDVELNFDDLSIIQILAFAEFLNSINQAKYMSFYINVGWYVLGSSSKILRKLAPQSLLLLANTLSTIPQNEVFQNYQYNSNKFELFQKNVATIISSSKQ